MENFFNLAAMLMAASPLFKLLLAVLVFLLFWIFKKKLTTLLSKLLYRVLNH